VLADGADQPAGRGAAQPDHFGTGAGEHSGGWVVAVALSGLSAVVVGPIRPQCRLVDADRRPAQWVMVSLTSSAILLSAIPAAESIPILLLAVPAGTLGDLVDRRRLILASQAIMLLAAVALAGLAVAKALTPWDLLGLLFVIGIGGAVSAPTWQTLQPELVPESERPQAIALGSVNQNLARAVGPAIGGLLLAATKCSTRVRSQRSLIPGGARRRGGDGGAGAAADVAVRARGGGRAEAS
jgi:MFS family permease